MLSTTRINGKCAQTIEEDLCAHMDTPLGKVIFCPSGRMICVELREGADLPIAMILRWSKIEIHFDHRVYCLDSICPTMEPIEAKDRFGFNFYCEQKFYVKFTPKSALN